MPKLAVYNSKGKEVGSVSIDDAFAAEKVNKGVLYQVIKHYLAAKHRGTHKVKTRSEVRGGGKKPWRQKGTGRARVGSIRSPLWRGGGIIFGPTVRNYSYTVPQKARHLALLEAIKSKIQDKDVVVFDKITLEKAKTKDIMAIIKSLKIDPSARPGHDWELAQGSAPRAKREGAVGTSAGLHKKCLMVQEGFDANIKLAARNIAGFSIMNRKDINALDVLKHDKLAVSEEALSKLLKENG